MARFPYTDFQIEEIVNTPKHPRDWEPVVFGSVPKSKNSRKTDVQLVRQDGRADRVRLVVHGQLDRPESYRAALLLENVRIRGVDYHRIPRSRFYKEVSPKGWHHDIIDPNLDPAESANHHRREQLQDFDPRDLDDFLRQVANLWNIVLPDQNEYLL